MSFTKAFLQCSIDVISAIDEAQVDWLIDHLAQIRQDEGRLFVIGSGGGAGHASHATCDFRKLCGIEAYAPYDNVSELTARVNDEGWDTTLAAWLKVSRLSSRDGVFIFSVGGGSESQRISTNLVNAIKFASTVGARVLGIVGKDGGYCAEMGNAVILVPNVEPTLVTPLTEGFQSLLWHLIVSHPKLQQNCAKWESMQALGDRQKQQAP